MANIHDVAAHILEKQGAMTTWKLQKLCYYSQAWHLVWEGEPLFPERIEAWANGPVAPALYEKHRRDFKVSAWPDGLPHALTAGEISSIDKVLEDYGQRDGAWLSELTHHEKPWLDARAGLDADERGNREITPQAMVEYYESLL